MAKTIFKSTEKSNFILNMTEEQYGKLASAGLLTACFATSLFTIIPTVSDTSTYTFSASGLVVSGVICMILALIALVKKYVSRSVILPAAAFGAMLLWGVVSLIFSYDYSVSLYGFPQRGEGLLALIFYFCFFVTAASIKRKKAVSTLITGVIGIGLLNSVWSLIQLFAGKLSHVSYMNISSIVNARAASGLAQSPVFLAMLLSLSLTAAAADCVLTEGKKRRIFDIVCICLFSFVLIFTRTIMGVFGVVFGVIAVFAAVLKGKAPKKMLLTILAVILSAAAAFILGATAMSGKNDGYRLYDGYIIWSDDAYQRIGASGIYSNNSVNVDDPLDVYSYLNSETIEIIKKYPIAGTGPEQLVYPQIYTREGFIESASVSDFVVINVGTFDKVYNEYLYTAATRGIPSLIALLIVIFSAFSIMRKKSKGSGSSADLITGLLTVCGALVFLIGCSNITFSPIFWACAGAACAELKESSGETEKKDGSKNSKRKLTKSS